MEDDDNNIKVDPWNESAKSGFMAVISPVQ